MEKSPSLVARPLRQAPPGRAFSAPPGRQFPCDSELLAEVLRVYKPECRYLKSATVTEQGDLASGQCELSIPAPFYIDDTGHFNAVEFNICYNQMVYCVVAKCVSEGLMGPFSHWTPEEFRVRQLPNFLIVDFQSNFVRPVNSHKFYGEIVFAGLRVSSSPLTRQAMYILETTCRFWDDTGGRCKGAVRLVVTDPPVRP